MNRQKIKIKYLLNLWKILPEYPTTEDVLFEIYSYLVKDERGEDFSQSTLDFIFRNNTEEEKVKIEAKIKELKDSNQIIVSKITGEGKEWFKIEKNPFI